MVPGAGIVEITYNLTLVPERRNELLANITVTSDSGQSTALLFEIFQRNQTQSCLSVNPRFYLASQEISNESLRIPISRSGSYCFVFDNEASQAYKTVLLATSVSSTFDEVRVSNDGEVNIAGLGVGALGLLLALAGFFKKTIIPWE